MTRFESCLEDPAPLPASRSARADTAALRLAAGSLLLGTLGVFLHEAGAHPITATWFRCAFGLAGLTAWMALRGGLGALRLPAGRRSAVWRVGGLMVTSWILFFTAIQRIPAGMATVLVHVQPLWVLMFSAWWLKEAVARRRLAGVVLAMAGLVLATGVPQAWMSAEPASPGSPGRDYWVGVALSLVCSLLMAGVTLLARRLEGIPASAVAWWQCALGTVFLAAWPCLDGWPAWGPAWVWLSGLGLVHTALAYSLIYGGLAGLAADRITVIQFAYPATALVIDWLVYRHPLDALQLCGIAMMAAAIWLAET